MGCPANDCASDNGPAHLVRLSAYAIDRTEVTESMWQKCVLDSARIGRDCSPRPDDVGAAPEASELPAKGLSWVQAKEVCAYYGRRLCTEAEWERAARGDDGERDYPWGDEDPDCERATFWTGSGPQGCGADGPRVVGGLPLGASVFGALDMAGNLSEWVADVYRSDVYATQAGASDPRVDTSADAPPRRVARGGSFASTALELRTFVRAAFDDDAEEVLPRMGARCCLSIGVP